MLTKEQVQDARENLEAVLEALCDRRDVDLLEGDIGWVRHALRALNGEMPPSPTSGQEEP